MINYCQESLLEAHKNSDLKIVIDFILVKLSSEKNIKRHIDEIQQIQKCKEIKAKPLAKKTYC